jgi:hypothetical protein
MIFASNQMKMGVSQSLLFLPQDFDNTFTDVIEEMVKNSATNSHADTSLSQITKCVMHHSNSSQGREL